jgi:Cysteine rich repeat
MVPPQLFLKIVPLKRWLPAKTKRITEMTVTLHRVATCAAALVAAAFTFATTAQAQAPSEAQRAAIKSECRNDYEAHCSSIAPGGAASLECLQKNMSSLSAACASAVRAVGSPTESKAEPKAEPSAEPAPATATAKPSEPAAAATAKPAPGKRPSSAQIAAVRSACRSDYPKVCADVPTGGAAALQCLAKNEARLTASCKSAVADATGSAAPAAATATAATGTAGAPANTASDAAASPAAPALVLRPLRPREVLFVARSACGADVRALCPGIEPGGGRIITCLVSQAASLSPACRSVLSAFAAR